MTTANIINSGALAVTTRTAGEEWSVTDRVTGTSYVIKKVGAGGTATITVSTPSIAATVIATSASAGIGAVGVGVSIGVSFATNLIGWAPATNTTYHYSTADAPASLTTGKRVKIESGVRGGDVFEYIGTPPLATTNGTVNLKTQDYGNTDLWKQVNLVSAPAEVQAWLRDSTVTAVGGLNQTALSDQSIDALVVAGSAAISAGAVGVGVSGAGAGAVNLIATEVKAFIEGDGTTTGIRTGGIALSATDTSSISAVTGAASIGAAFGAVGVGVSIGVAGAHNEISNDVAAYIANADTGVSASGPVSITAKEAATINALTSAASLGVGIGAVGVAVSGAGAGATNIILTKTNAYVADSKLTTTGGATGTVAIAAEDSSAINAIVATTSASVGIGAVGVGVSLGASVARNLIGYNLLDVRTPAQVQAYITHSTVTASGALSQTATTNETIRAAVLSGSAAISAGAVGVAVSGSGVLAINKIATDVKAFISNVSTVTAASVSLTADDTSSISADAGAAAITAAFGGVGVAVSIGAALAHNQIENAVEASITNGTVTATSLAGSISLTAEENATITARTAAAAASAAIGAVGVAVSGAGAVATNIILTTTNAYADGSVLDSAGNVAITANNTASIDATVISAAASLGGGLAGISGSIGASVARNLIGYTLAGVRTPAQVQAYVKNSSIDADGHLVLEAKANETITAAVLSGAVALSAGLSADAASAASVTIENKVATQVKATHREHQASWRARRRYSLDAQRMFPRSRQRVVRPRSRRRLGILVRRRRLAAPWPPITSPTTLRPISRPPA